MPMGQAASPNSAGGDVIIVGAGHNGLVAASYLAQAGFSVQVFERRHQVGGAAITDEFVPGYRNSICAYVVSLLNPRIIEDLDLPRHGLEIMDRADHTLIPGRSAGSGHFFSEHDASFHEAVRALSIRDAERIGAFEEVLQMAADVLRELAEQTPPNLGGGLMDLLRAGKLANRLRRLGPEMQAEFLKIMTMSVAEYLDEWFESPVLKTLFSQQAFVGNMVSPYAPGSAYVLIHHYFGEINGKTGAWGHARGGMGAISEAMASAARERGVAIEVNAPVRQILVEDGTARGVELADGRTFRARAVAANTNPKLLFSELVPDGAVSADFRRRITNYRSHSGTLRINLAVKQLPEFTCLTDLSADQQAERLQGLIMFSGDWQYCEAAFHDAVTQGWSAQPIIEMYIPTTIDDSLAPPGQHVISLFCQHFAYELPDGRHWDEEKHNAAEHVIDFLSAYCPNLPHILVGMQVLTPLDLEREFGLTGGCIMHGVLSLDQMFSMRPVPGYANYRMPLDGLYLCGSGAHPGGGVSGNPGRNAAREIIKDLRRKRV